MSHRTTRPADPVWMAARRLFSFEFCVRLAPVVTAGEADALETLLWEAGAHSAAVRWRHVYDTRANEEGETR